MEDTKTPVIQPLLRLQSTTSWASPRPSSPDTHSLPPITSSIFRGCEFAYQKTVVYENGLRFVRKSYQPEHFPAKSLDWLGPTYANSCDSGMFADMDKRSDRTFDGNFSVCSDPGIDEEPAYSVPGSVRPLEVDVTIRDCDQVQDVLSEVFECGQVNNPIYMELEPLRSFINPPPIYSEMSEIYSEPPVESVESPTTYKEPPKPTPVKGAVVKKVTKYKSSAERRMMSVEKTNREVFEKPCPIRMVYRRQSQRRLQSRARVERVVPRLTQLCVQVLISEVSN